MLLPYERALKIYCVLVSLKNFLISHKVDADLILNEHLLNLILERKGYRILFSKEYLSIFKGHENGELFYYNKSYLNADKISFRFYNDKRQTVIDFDNNFLSRLLRFLIPDDKDIQAMKDVDPNDYTMLKEISFDNTFNCITKIMELYNHFHKEMDTLDSLKDITGISNYERSIDIDEERVYSDLKFIYLHFLSKDCNITTSKRVVKYDAGVCKTIMNDYLEKNGFEIIYNGGVGIPNIYDNRTGKVDNLKTIIVCFNSFDAGDNALVASQYFERDLDYRLRMSLYDSTGYREEFYMSFFDKDFPRDLLIDLKESYDLPERVFSKSIINAYLKDIRVSTTNLWWAFVELREILLDYMKYQDSLKGDKLNV